MKGPSSFTVPLSLWITSTSTWLLCEEACADKERGQPGPSLSPGHLRWFPVKSHCCRSRLPDLAQNEIPALETSRVGWVPWFLSCHRF